MNNLTIHRLTADKREMKDSPKLPAAISFIRQSLGESIYAGSLL